MDQAGLGPRDLVPFNGNQAKVAEVLSGKRTLTVTMARAARASWHSGGGAALEP